MFLARLEGAPLIKAYTPYVVKGGRPITQSKSFIWKTIGDRYGADRPKRNRSQLFGQAKG